MRAPKKRFDFTVILLIVLILAAGIAVFLKPIETPYFDTAAASKPVRLEYNEFKLECSLVGLNKGYDGTILILNDEYKHYTLRYIHENILVGTNIRHVLMETIPEYVFALAFAGVDGVTVYTDAEITPDMEWAQYVTIRPVADFEELIHPTYDFPYYFDFSLARLQEAIADWAGSEEIMLTTTVPFALLIIALCVLRQKLGFPNPLWPIFKPCFSKKLFVFFTVLTGIVTATALFCETAELDFYDQMGWDLYVITEFMLDYPVKILAVVHILFLVSDLFRRDFPWFVARWVVRAAIIVLAIIAFAIAGWLAGWIVGANLGLFRLLWFLGLLMFLSTIFGGGTIVNKGVTSRLRPDTVIADDGTSMRVDCYSHGIYVGGDQIVGEGDTTMTGASGNIYKKY